MGCDIASLSALQKQLANIRQIQGQLQQSHERSKVVTRGADMRQLREEMQVRFVVASGQQSHTPSDGHTAGVLGCQNQTSALLPLLSACC
jgi:hypothetical protein